jgi:hypothetical protein
MRYCLLLIIKTLVLIPFLVLSQTDNIGSGRAIQFDGIDDNIIISNSYKTLNVPFTISAWVFLDPSGNFVTPIFVTNDNNPTYRGFWFAINRSTMLCEFGDGTGGNNPVFRRGKQASIPNFAGRWINVCAVMNAPFDIKLYINGIDVGGNSSGDSNLPMASPYVGDSPKIGYFLSNNVVYRDKSSLDEIRLWNRALSETEIRQDLCKKLVGNEPGLIGYWDFNETSGNIVFDKSPSGFNGQLVGNPTRVYSGAPIGEVSSYLYSSSLTGKTLSLQDGIHKIEVKNINVAADGVQIYEVKNVPSQTSGLDASQDNKPYFGVFIANQNATATFDAEYSYQGATTCKSFSRADNSIAVWGKVDNPLKGKAQRAEFLFASGGSAIFDLGSNQILCDKTSHQISTGITDPQFSIQWSNGEISSSIFVSQSGLYFVKVTGPCGVQKDSVTINFLTKPKSFSLGSDTEYCVFKPINLKPLTNSNGFTFKWQDGSINDSYEVKEFGKYSVTINNFCGQASDTISYSKLEQSIDFLPNVITPNGDDKNENFMVDSKIVGLVSLAVINRWGQEVYYSSAYDNKWNGGELSAGVYYVVLEGSCIKKTKGAITILR